MIVWCIIYAIILAGITLLAIIGYVEIAVIVLLSCFVFICGMITGSILDD